MGFGEKFRPRSWGLMNAGTMSTPMSTSAERHRRMDPDPWTVVRGFRGPLDMRRFTKSIMHASVCSRRQSIQDFVPDRRGCSPVERRLSACNLAQHQSLSCMPQKRFTRQVNGSRSRKLLEHPNSATTQAVLQCQLFTVFVRPCSYELCTASFSIRVAEKNCNIC